MPNFASRLLAISGLLLAVAGTPSFAASTGVVALFNGEKTYLAAMASSHDCDIKRQGVLLARQGNLELPELDRFAVLSCPRSPLKHSEGGVVLAADSPETILLEGDLQAFETGSDTRAEQREYLLKLSYYTNSDLVGRARDLAALADAIAPLSDPYRTESFLEVHRAAGLPTPDEVVTLFYDSPEAGNRFREANQEILEQVGAFNKAHLVSFVYLIAKAD